ncbi:MAG: UDP-N-acetylmuramate--alanine ligase [Urechidicola sp.]|jgi:UDP-N-acetylmuramate--alanine ligase|tara:strand:+ start:10109 stop:11476 length:1368 start_codon:yes stop_codon:yes gene_type:complete
MNLNQVHTVYFIGIGGIGMSALARYFNSKAISVFGYDLTSTALTQEMESNGMIISYLDDVFVIPDNIKQDKENTLVIYTPAIPESSEMFNYFKENGFALMKRAEVLGMITKSFKTIAVAGTHGKTTTSSMIAVVMEKSKLKCNAFLGGILTNYNSNIVLDSSSDWVVVEADEYDRSFLTLVPNIAVVTSTDADHLDIYGDSDSLNKSFQDFVNKVNLSGKVFLQEEVSLKFKNKEKYSLNNENSNYYTKNITVDNGNFMFDAVTPKGVIKSIKLGISGLHNIENAMATIAVCQEIGLEDKEIKKGLEEYKGVKRRFEYQIKQSDLIFIDDYAHHPTEIKALVSSVKELYPAKKITGIFQPHLFSRTKDFADDFAIELSQLDEVIVLDVYAARELPMNGVDAEFLLNKVTSSNKRKETKETVIGSLDRNKLEVLLTIGAGDINTLVAPIREKLIQQ